MINKSIDENMNNIKIADHFWLYEFECPCCHRVMVHPDLLDYLNAVRKDFERPILISSGYRCEIHNIYIGGKEDSKHLYGEAADLVPEVNSLYQELLTCVLRHAVVNNIKVVKKKDHIHVEVT